MSDPAGPAGASQAGSGPEAAKRERLVRSRGAPASASVLRVERFRFSDSPADPAQQVMQKRLRVAGIVFTVLFALVGLKLADATVIEPMTPRPVAQARRPEPIPPPLPAGAMPAPMAVDYGLRKGRATITDRRGTILAVSLPTANVFAVPGKMIDAQDAVLKLKAILPRLDVADIARRLADERSKFVYIAHRVTPKEQMAINALGIVGVEFEETEQRHYPLGNVAAHVLGGVTVDGQGSAGVELFFNKRLASNPAPLKLSLDAKVQAVVRDELSRAMGEFNAIGGAGIVMDVRTGEVIAMVSLPDYDANNLGRAAPDSRFNRTVAGIYEPGSTFKLQDAALALDSGTVNIWNGFDASAPIHIGRFTIKDFEGGKHRWLYVPEIVAYSSNIGAARMAEAVGGEKQRLWMDRMGMLSKLGIELPEAAHPQAPGASNWKQIATMTIGFGHGISVSPLHVVAGTAAISNGGTYYRPTLVAGEADAPPREGIRVMQQQTSDIMRKLMRVVVTEGYGKLAEVPGYYIGGKTGTAEKISHHGYNKKVNVSAFMSAFPMNAPRYAVYMMLDEPHGNASTGGYSTAGAVSAPAAGRVVAKIGPMLEMLPDIANAPAINAALSIPLQPGRPAWAKPSPGQPVGQPPVAGGAPMAANPAPAAPRATTTPPPPPKPAVGPAPAQVLAVR